MKTCTGCEREVTPAEPLGVGGDDDGLCASCVLYNGAVAAQGTAARSIASARVPGSERAWLNEHGIFAWVDGVTEQVGTKDEAAPFAALTQNARLAGEKR